MFDVPWGSGAEGRVRGGSALLLNETPHSDCPPFPKGERIPRKKISLFKPLERLFVQVVGFQADDRKVHGRENHDDVAANVVELLRVSSD